MTSVSHSVYFQLKVKFRARDGSVVKNACCSCGGPGTVSGGS